jgi:hypothetical protein
MSSQIIWRVKKFPEFSEFCSRNFKFKLNARHIIYMHLFDTRKCEEGKERRKEERESELVELDKGYKGVTVVKRTKRTHAKR